MVATSDFDGVKEPADAIPRLQSVVESHKVVMFGTSHCPFCLEVESTMKNLGVNAHMIHLDRIPSGPFVRTALNAATNQRTVPYVYINGKFVGGCDDVKQLQTQGKLDSLLVGSMEEGQKTCSPCGVDSIVGPVYSRLFNFPATVDNRLIRLTGAQVTVLSVLGAVFKGTALMHWVIIGLFADFTLRFFSGPSLSPLAMNSSIVIAVLERFTDSKPQFSPGPPKQFASMCGMMFSGLGALFLLLNQSNDESWSNWLGAAWLIGLAGAAAMEAFLNFCLGCVFFSIGIYLGVFPKGVYTVHLNTKTEMVNTWDVMNTRLGQVLGEPISKQHQLHQRETVVDRKYKVKTDEITREDFNMLKHMKMSYMMLPVDVCALAALWKMVHENTDFMSEDANHIVFQVVRLIGVVMSGVGLLSLCARQVLWPKKLCKEWYCPVNSNMLSLPLILLMLVAWLFEEDSKRAAQVLFWVAAPAHLLLSVALVARWAFRAHDFEHVSPALLLPVAGNFVAGLVLPVLRTSEVSHLDFPDLAQLWWGFAFFMWFPLFAITLAKVFLAPNVDPTMRPLLFVWVATPSLAALGGGEYSQHLYFFALAMFAVMMMGFWPHRFFGAGKFHMSYCGYGLGVVALAMATVSYQVDENSQLTRRMVVCALVAANWAVGVIVQHYFAGVIRGTIYTPESKWGPMSFMRLTHEAFRDIMPQLISSLDEIVGSSGASANHFVRLWGEFVRLHDVHSVHEDTIIFPMAATYFPGCADTSHDEHKKGHSVMDKISALVLDLQVSQPPAVVVDQLKSLVGNLCTEMEEHLQGEEAHIQPIIRKYLPLAIHKEIVRRVFKETDTAKLYDYIPLVLNHLPHQQQRERFVRTWLWAMPESAQHVGLMVSLGVSPVMWYQLSQEIPDIVPRGAKGWKRFF
eukprot:CAMPEP_0114246674 /NCGR_PEP_ID=MMETSP0058-20121206/12600_1 /TAXON_ID=36894 /ORGANISM="Pyramimonas parkeae, CCMP726" /LENGTH=909 /DNA_ID=CAMNT_0001359899 /DNA_START=188 /DNA_END=2917 /DNA_ORIENTATION=-